MGSENNPTCFGQLCIFSLAVIKSRQTFFNILFRESVHKRHPTDGFALPAARPVLIQGYNTKPEKLTLNKLSYSEVILVYEKFNFLTLKLRLCNYGAVCPPF